ncbi:hypothetical protein ACFL5U_03520, partial [Candidatus Margulisiibacteriota bacterium]
MTTFSRMERRDRSAGRRGKGGGQGTAEDLRRRLRDVQDRPVAIKAIRQTASEMIRREVSKKTARIIREVLAQCDYGLGNYAKAKVGFDLLLKELPQRSRSDRDRCNIVREWLAKCKFQLDEIEEATADFLDLQETYANRERPFWT